MMLRLQQAMYLETMLMLELRHILFLETIMNWLLQQGMFLKHTLKRRPHGSMYLGTMMQQKLL